MVCWRCLEPSCVGRVRQAVGGSGMRVLTGMVIVLVGLLSMAVVSLDGLSDSNAQLMAENAALSATIDSLLAPMALPAIMPEPVTAYCDTIWFASAEEIEAEVRAARKGPALGRPLVHDWSRADTMNTGELYRRVADINRRLKVLEDAR